MYGTDSFPLTGNRELRQRTPLFDVAVGLVLASCIGAMGAQRPQLLALGAPFLVLVALAFARWRPVDGQVRIGIDAPHIVEGDRFNVIVEVEAGAARLDRVEVELHLSDRVSAPVTIGVTRPPSSATATETSAR